MMNRYALEAIDRMLRDVCGRPEIAFAGKVMLFGGVSSDITSCKALLR